MVAVSSVVIKDLDYNPDTFDLIVTFANGARWKYKDVPNDVYNNFLNAHSAGNFFHNNIKNGFDGEPV